MAKETLVFGCIYDDEWIVKQDLSKNGNQA